VSATPTRKVARRDEPMVEGIPGGKKRLAGDTAREATSDEVKEHKAEARPAKVMLAEVLIENRATILGARATKLTRWALPTC
jgi:hypothetical protein